MESIRANTLDWPECRARVFVNSEKPIASCTHGQVRTRGNFVTRQVCELCSLRNTSEPPSLESPTESLSLRKLGWNVAVSLASFVADGARTVSLAQFQSRLEVCSKCDRRRGNRCRECGCQLTLKASGRVFRCPLGKWAE